MSERRGSKPVAMPETPGADLAISDVSAGGFVEYVTIANRGQIDQPLSGWALASLHGGDVYLFPEGTTIGPGRRIRIVSGEEAQAQGAGDLLWERRSIWSNRSDTVLLFDNLGREVKRFVYPRPEIREDRVPKRKLLVERPDGFHLVDWDKEVPPPEIREEGL